MKRFAVGMVCLLFGSAVFADVSVLEKRGLEGQGAGKPKKQGRDQVRTGEQTFTDASDLDYFINSNITFTTSSSASGAASEASYSGPVQADTSGGGLVASTLNDSFDGYGSLCVSLNGSLGPCVLGGGGGGQVAGANSVTMYNNNGAGTLDASCGNRQLILNNQMFGAVRVQRKIFVPSNDTFIRWYQTFTNTGVATENVTAITSNNLGSDATTSIVTTSSGDALVTTADTWATSFQAFSGTTSSDVRLGHVFWGPGAATGLNAINFVNGDDNPFWSYRFTLAPGETKAIMTFATGQPTRALAAAKAAELVGLPENATQCLSTAELNQTANFAGQVPFVTEVPTVSTVGLIATALLLAGASFFLLRRRTTA
jgi:hypothetical protein